MNETPKNKLKTNDSNIIKFGFTVILIVFIICGSWMYFANLDNASVATGQVSADVDKKTVQHLEGGIVKEIYVKDGDLVKKGDKLLKIDDIQIKSQLEIYEDQYYYSLAVKDRLIAQRDNLNIINFKTEISEDLKSVQNSIFFNTKKSIEDENKITENRIKQLNNQIDGLNSLIDSKKNRALSIKEEIKEWEELLKEQLTDKIRIRDLNRELNLLEGEISNTYSEIAKSEEQISELMNQKLLKEKEFRKETLDKLAEYEMTINDLESKILALKDTLKRTIITAPIEGNIVGLNLHTIGGVISPNSKILDIVPISSDLLIVAQVQTTDVDKVKEGLLADIRFSAFNLKQAHVIEGKVIHLSADSFTDEVTGAQYYKAKIELTSKGLEELSKLNFHLVPGMPAEVMIKVGERTVLSYLIKPFTDMLARGFNED